VEYDKDDGVSHMKNERWEPPDWKKQLGFIREMRSNRDAPVDNMGAEKSYDTEAPAHVGYSIAHIFLFKVSVIYRSNLLLCSHHR